MKIVVWNGFGLNGLNSGLSTVQWTPVLLNPKWHTAAATYGSNEMAKKLMKSRVLILGAGASKEVNLSIGTELKLKIERLLKIQFQHGFQQESSDYQIT